ncbi:MAG TPA: hypothetical protein VK469_05050 [Candidatus Kapabacteria bacterium]|nr:hypothetical protein [Candidatus Kapabacteria bacterium]
MDKIQGCFENLWTKYKDVFAFHGQNTRIDGMRTKNYPTEHTEGTESGKTFGVVIKGKGAY